MDINWSSFDLCLTDDIKWLYITLLIEHVMLIWFDEIRISLYEIPYQKHDKWTILVGEMEINVSKAKRYESFNLIWIYPSQWTKNDEQSIDCSDGQPPFATAPVDSVHDNYFRCLFEN